MMTWIVAAVGLLLPAQDPSLQDLLRKMKSDRIEEREEAARAMEKLGRKAVSALEEAAKDPDRELADRARDLLRLLHLREILSPRLRQAVPGIEQRLASGDDVEWTRMFLEVTGLDDQRCRALSGLSNDDVAPLVPAAVRGARTELDYSRVTSAVSERGLREAVPELVRSLDRRELRHITVSTLGSIGGSDAVVALRGCLSDPDPQVGSMALSALAIHPAKEVLKDVFPLLKKPMLQGNAAYLLGEIGSPEAIPPLLALLPTIQGKGRLPFVRALGLLRAREAVPLIGPFLWDPDQDVQREALQAVVVMDREVAIPALVEASRRLRNGWRNTVIHTLLDLEAEEVLPLARLQILDAGDWDVDSSWSTHPFAQKRKAELLKHVLPLLRDESRTVRAAAIGTVGFMGTKDLLPVLRPFLRDPEPIPRFRAVQALGSLGDRDSAGLIRELLRDPDADVRAAAARALGELRDEASLPALLSLLESEDEDEAKTAAHALGAIGSPKSRKTLTRLLKDQDPEIATSAAFGLLRMKSPPPFREIVSLFPRVNGFRWPHLLDEIRILDRPEPVSLLERDLESAMTDPERWALIEALGRLGRPEAVPILRKYADRGEWFTLEALVSLAPGEASGDCLRALKNPESSLRVAAVQGLSTLRATGHAGEIAAVLGDPDQNLRAAAAEALGSLGATRYQSELELLLLDRFPYVRLAAAQGLLALGSRAGVEPLLRETRYLGHSPTTRYFGLNAIRNPEAWNRLRSHVLHRDLPLSTSVILERIPEETGLPITHDPAMGVHDGNWIQGSWAKGELPRGTTLLETLLQVMEGSDCELILEKDRIRYLRFPEARKFWETWWTSEIK